MKSLLVDHVLLGLTCKIFHQSTQVQLSNEFSDIYNLNNIKLHLIKLSSHGGKWKDLWEFLFKWR
ncbi:hypothetical protein Ahy_B10g101392 isoform B [Arachis hypogaea]|uniref:Uncharacterized protein n=1 Tax=Arachis hypogaea TaxID=3818 RepID=A0A444WZJ6_ARAHY|nr:hypothetical protein Ahy_B10g101392 isoform B [Arachis hypogaea]